ncbi:hypothetical protein OS493_000208 [Desmophyllum pertusum]|uniref:Uncharacterized protein n=1 Tax=Desmophyllum pertusum TaxID=174260 RepID=A0A9X0A7T9_9CNID|nr:hypothetical protein OS493_000208 [Desmophyllum pertusum]
MTSLDEYFLQKILTFVVRENPAVERHSLCERNQLQGMENSSDRFFKGFSLEDYRLQVLVNRLEKEKKQCLNRLKEETHVFKMSVRLPVKEEYWSQYGENFHANGDKRERGSITHLSTEHNKEVAKFSLELEIARDGRDVGPSQSLVSLRYPH